MATAEVDNDAANFLVTWKLARFPHAFEQAAAWAGIAELGGESTDVYRGRLLRVHIHQGKASSGVGHAVSPIRFRSGEGGIRG